MTKSEIFKLAHAEARRTVKVVGDYAIAFKLALKAIYNEPALSSINDVVDYLNDVLAANGLDNKIVAESESWDYSSWFNQDAEWLISFKVIDSAINSNPYRDTADINQLKHFIPDIYSILNDVESRSLCKFTFVLA